MLPLITKASDYTPVATLDISFIFLLAYIDIRLVLPPSLPWALSPQYYILLARLRVVLWSPVGDTDSLK